MPAQSQSREVEGVEEGVDAAVVDGEETSESGFSGFSDKQDGKR